MPVTSHGPTWRRGGAQQTLSSSIKAQRDRDRDSDCDSGNQQEPGVRSSLRAGQTPEIALHTNLRRDLQTSRAWPKRKYNTRRQGMGDCSTPQPKRPGGCATNPSADREPEEAETLPEQAATQAQVRQAQLEGKGSIVRFLLRTATGSPELGREHARTRATEEEADSQNSTEEQRPYRAQARQTSTDTVSPIEGIRTQRSFSCPALPTTGHHDSSLYDASLSQAGTARHHPRPVSFPPQQTAPFSVTTPRWSAPRQGSHRKHHDTETYLLQQTWLISTPINLKNTNR
ncbi:hypothetical protein NDU88_003360 [Pleurodeles waltl]|uniref:Uncharacterized protein n=1 Tax=Pleurodeles waltl TaxID=8319 RepID=A0AAV7VGC8_PLEWA|nr:hypothetical protein NDU88_003360 [Pleurodeles waltl]